MPSTAKEIFKNQMHFKNCERYFHMEAAFEGVAYACYDCPEMIDDMVETNCLLIERYLDQVLPYFDFDAVSFYALK